MTIAAMMIDSRRLWPGEALWEGPLAFVDLGTETASPDQIALPPCPLIGLGDPGHPLAALVDAVIEPPVTAEGLAAQVVANPHAAAVIVQLLRVLPSLSLEEGLTVESLAYGLLQGSAEHRRLAGGAVRNPRADTGSGRTGAR